jgi:hypothetical protein
LLDERPATAHRVHERVDGATPPKLAPGSILHHSFNGCADVIVRSARYSGPKAAILRDKGETSPAWMLPIRGLAAFTKSYCLQGGWRDGAAGFIVALSRVIERKMLAAEARTKKLDQSPQFVLAKTRADENLLVQAL